MQTSIPRPYMSFIQHTSPRIMRNIDVKNSLFYNEVNFKSHGLVQSRSSKMDQTQTYMWSRFYIKWMRGMLICDKILSHKHLLYLVLQSPISYTHTSTERHLQCRLANCTFTQQRSINDKVVHLPRYLILARPFDISTHSLLHNRKLKTVQIGR